MGMTMSQKILAAHAGLDHVEAGQLIEASLDLVLGNDVTAPVAINEFEKCGAKGVFSQDKIALVMDHFTPNKDIKAAEQTLKVRRFANQYDILNYFDVGRMGIEHAGAGPGGARQPGDRRGFPYLHLRRAGGLLYRRRVYRHVRGHDDRQGLV